MAKLLVLHNPPADAAAFNDYYAATHVPLAKKVPGLRKLEVSTGEVKTEGPAPYHMVVSLTFDSVADLHAGLASPQGQAAVADLANFATAGATMLIFQEQEL